METVLLPFSAANYTDCPVLSNLLDLSGSLKACIKATLTELCVKN